MALRSSSSAGRGTRSRLSPSVPPRNGSRYKTNGAPDRENPVGMAAFLALFGRCDPGGHHQEAFGIGAALRATRARFAATP